MGNVPGEVDAAPEVSPGGPPVTATPTVREIAYCYRTADITVNDTNHRIPIGIDTGDAAQAIRDICAAIWTGNDYQWSPHPLPAPPPLVACVLNWGTIKIRQLNPGAGKVREGAVGVYPGDASTCSVMGMADAAV